MSSKLTHKLWNASLTGLRFDYLNEYVVILHEWVKNGYEQLFFVDRGNERKCGC